MWDGEGSAAPGEIEIFPQFHASPFSRLLTINRKGPFNVSIVYGQQVPYPDQTIGVWKIKDVKPTERGEGQDVKLKVRINNNGIVLISSATLVEKKEADEAAAAEQAAGEEKPNDQAGGANNGGEPTDGQQEVSYCITHSLNHIILPIGDFFSDLFYFFLFGICIYVVLTALVA